MRKTILLVLFSLFVANTFAQAGSDSLAYQLQRKKINQMLAERKQKFGQYDQSLSQHTGIFGFQTKKDIRHSNDILMDIVKTDNDIFGQLKILLEYRTFQQTQVQQHSADAENSNIGYMNTINRLQNDNQRLKKEAIQAEDDRVKHFNISMGLIIGLIVVVLLLLRSNYLKKSKQSIA
jgi:hypothetical protein